MGRRLLAVNADDFGFTRDVNAGIVEAHTKGILTSTTLMANGAAFDDAVRLAGEVPTLDIGVHLVLVGGESLLAGGRSFPKTVSELMKAVTLRQVRVYDELRAQMVKIFDAGLRPTHLDTHKHTHLFPPVLDAVVRLSEEFGVHWVRRPFDLPITGSPRAVPLTKRVVSRMFGSVRGQFHRKLARHGCRTTDWFAGFQITGRFQAEDVVHLLENLPEGSTEFMVHPGFCTAELQAARTRLKESRAEELAALVDPRVMETVKRVGIELCGYGDGLGGG
ncbi:ChbG/HpnK family deacetylase [Paludibaculum fermentans]|uniref:ChbG/HpnK family deacetylase n=1 Tax=Paludibaculum fermentans TaxID=1473598 RepID=UPI003EBB5144